MVYLVVDLGRLNNHLCVLHFCKWHCVMPPRFWLNVLVNFVSRYAVNKK